MSESVKAVFFKEIQRLAEEHGIAAYVLVTVIPQEGGLAIATSAGTKLDDDSPATKRVYEAMVTAFERGMDEIIRREDEPPEGGLLN